MSASRKLIFAFLIITSASIIESYRILGVFPYNGKSHNVMFNALMEGLAKRGHQVDAITHFPIKNAPPNYKVLVNLNGTLEDIVNSFTYAFIKSEAALSAALFAEKYGNEVCELMGMKEMQKVIKNPPKNPPYDIVITEVFGAHCYLGLGHHFNVPVVAVSSAVEYPWISSFTGNNDNLAFVASPLLPSFDRTRFADRLINFVSSFWNTYKFSVLTDDIQTDLMRKYLNPKIPHIRDIERSIDLTLVNSHPVIFGSKPLIGSLVEVGGLHVEEYDEKLPKDLQKWLDESVDGVVYFTLGSLVLIETFPENMIKDIYKSFEKIAPMRVLTKIVDKTKLPPGLPNNVWALPWIPQQAVLAHKNVRVFMTHGGLMGSQEALYFGVPTIGIPLFGDQARNVAAFVGKKIGVRLDLNNITSTSLDKALGEVLQPIYRQNAKLYSKLFKDRPMSGMDTAAFWIEYIIRNRPYGSSILRSPAYELSFWQLALLDIYGFILLGLISMLVLIYYATKLVLKSCCAKSTGKSKVQ